ncbi:NAD+ synthase [Rhizobiales bacterium]|uniref:NAD+ synthase n=1 Tax=Hongsoonwoonella zoysiae TaxID=2821844 RepID=UPI00156040F5|nr:NAD+ synthase [Hongsoonwoonella zoysiae]NRG18613.1 NAD+ synthase [Hongsoonwoonella zoysiae]
MTDESSSRIENRFRIAVAQLNPTVGDVRGNLDLARKARAEAKQAGADLLLLSELFLSGYPPEDLVLKPAFVAACRAALDELAEDTKDGGPGVVIGLPWREGELLHNAVAVVDGGRIEGVRFKFDLPNYGEFDEKRVFQPGLLPSPVGFRGVRLGVPVCEDVWTDEVCECLAETGAEILLVPNGSPYYANKADVRLQVAVARVVENELPFIYCNQVGGQDELVFDGGSFALQPNRQLAFQMKQFEEGIGVSDWVRQESGGWVCEGGEAQALPDVHEANWRACVLGLRDYVRKNGFPGVVLGLSGGIDSAVVAAMAVDALGPEKVHCVMLPYRYTSEESITDADQLARDLGIRYDTVPIAEPVEGFQHALAKVFEGTQSGVTEENLQSRARGVVLMAISNKFGYMVVTTGNKSEMSVGYATLYGDMNGGFNPIKDLYKSEVYALAAWRNENRPEGMKGPDGTVIPPNILTKEPSAELAEGQKDQDSLPPYDVLDDILECLVENEMSVGDIEARGHSRELIHRIENLLYIAEYKRRQSAPGVKITRKNFGRDRRYPITNRFRDRS